MEFKLLKAASPATPTPLMFKSAKPISLFGLQTKKNLNCMSMGLARKSWKPLQVSAASTEMTPRVDESESLTLESIRSALIRQEDSIIYGLLERSQYSYNPEAYDHCAFAMDNFHGSLVEFIVKETEKLHAKVGRYKSPDEHPFFPADLPEPMLPPLQYPQVLHPIADSININKKVWEMYFEGLLPKLVKEGSDGNYGSTAVCDTTCLQMEEAKRPKRGQVPMKKEAMLGITTLAIRYAMAKAEREVVQAGRGSINGQEPPEWAKIFFKKIDEHFKEVGTRLEKLESGYEGIRRDMDLMLEGTQGKPAMDDDPTVEEHVHQDEDPLRRGKEKEVPGKPQRKRQRQRKLYDGNGCFKCGDENHKKKDCPQLGGQGDQGGSQEQRGSAGSIGQIHQDQQGR